MAQPLSCHPLDNIPEIGSGDALGHAIADACGHAGLALADGDVIVVCQKIVSKAEGRLVALSSVSPSAEAERLAALTGKDPRLVELVLSESDAVVRAVPNLLIVRHRLGFTVANAGIDQSNVSGDDEAALLLPVDPDASARELRAEIAALTGTDVAVVINDSFGRPWRLGTCGTAIGCDGLIALDDLRGRTDRNGRVLRHSEVAVADEIAAGASLVMGQADEGCPAVLVRGVSPALLARSLPASTLIRPAAEDRFR